MTSTQLACLSRIAIDRSLALKSVRSAENSDEGLRQPVKPVMEDVTPTANELLKKLRRCILINLFCFMTLPNSCNIF